MLIINALGKLCPLPVIETKKAILSLPKEGGIIKIAVDNIIATENLAKMAQQKGYGYSMQKRADHEYVVAITVGEGHSLEPAQASLDKTESGSGLVVAIGKDRMGEGNEELGKILIKGFIFSLSSLDIPPRAVIFFNSGIKLTIAEANTLDDLKTLKAKGTTILVCGACVDFYDSKDKVAVGEISNMYTIVETLSSAAKVINI